MTRLVRWLLQARYRLVVLAAILAPVPLAACVSTALTTLETLHRGPRQGLLSAVAATLGVFLLTFVWGGSPGATVLAGGAVLLAGTALGALLRRVGSLAVAFQGVALFCVSGAFLGALIWPEPGGWVTTTVEQLADVVRATGATEQQVSSLADGWARFLVGLIIASIFLQLMVALLLGSWLAARVQQKSLFGHQFRQLRLGRILGIPATLLMASSLYVDGAMVRNLFPLVLIAFCFQGLAVVHAWAWTKQWNPAFLVPMYVLLMSPFTGIPILVLASVGLMDNWIELRAPLRANVDGRN